MTRIVTFVIKNAIDMTLVSLYNKKVENAVCCLGGGKK